MPPLLALALRLCALLVAPPDMVAVPAGRLAMGDAGGEFDERPVHVVRLSAYLIDRTEVSAGEYRLCVALGRCRPPRRAVNRSGPEVPASGPEVPATWVSWEDAAAYCRFAGKRLPTEAEWERAARGDDGRRYPWGEAPACDRANFGNYRGEGRCEGNPGRPEPVGQRPAGASPFGALDLGGNVWEWVADRYDPRYYARSPARDPQGPAGPPGREAGPRAGPGSSGRRVVRGDGCCSLLGLPRAANRAAFPPDYADEDLGFRCARSAAPGGATGGAGRPGRP